MELEDNYSLLQDNTISILKNYPRFLTLLKAISNRLDSLQDCINYLCEKTTIDTAEGVWLDYIAWLVGTTRTSFDIADYFCLNQTGYFTYYGWTNNGTTVYTLSETPTIGDKVFSDTSATELGTVEATDDDEITVSSVVYAKDSDKNVSKPGGDLNVPKLFYFKNITSTGDDTLEDVYLRKRIKAKIGYNKSKCTRNENIKIIRDMLNADKVVISNVSPMVLDITIYGDNLFYPSSQSLRASIENVLGNGVGIRNLTII